MNKLEICIEKKENIQYIQTVNVTKYSCEKKNSSFM